MSSLEKVSSEEADDKNSSEEEDCADDGKRFYLGLKKQRKW